MSSRIHVHVFICKEIDVFLVDFYVYQAYICFKAFTLPDKGLLTSNINSFLTIKKHTYAHILHAHLNIFICTKCVLYLNRKSLFPKVIDTEMLSCFTCL